MVGRRVEFDVPVLVTRRYAVGGAAVLLCLERHREIRRVTKNKSRPP